jgi:hypothetical protein
MKFPRFYFRQILLALAGSLAIAANASASLIGSTASFSFTTSQVAAGLPPGPYGTILLTQQLNDVDVLITLSSGFAFANTNVGPAFSFNLSSGFTGATTTVTGVSTTWFMPGAGSPFNATPYGNFTNSIVFKASAGNGLSSGVITPLSFSVAQAGIDITNFNVFSTAFNNGQPGGFQFAADVGYLASGKTGDVTTGDGGGGGNNGQVPEPATLLLLSLGVLGAAAVRRRSKV